MNAFGGPMGLILYFIFLFAGRVSVNAGMPFLRYRQRPFFLPGGNAKSFSGPQKSGQRALILVRY